MFKWFKRKRSYAEIKRELEVREELYSRMTTLSDTQMERWVSTKVDLENMRHQSGVVYAINDKRDVEVGHPGGQSSQIRI